jgi:uncharacterized phage protein gp47/JayE
MPFTTLSQDDLEALYRAYLRSLIPDADVSPFSDADIEARVLAALYAGNQSQGEFIAKQILPSTSDDDWVVLHAKEEGIARRPAVKSRGYVLVENGGISDIQAALSEFTHDDGTVYKLDTPTAYVTPGAYTVPKTIVAGSTESTLFISPNVDDISPLTALNIASGQTCIVKEVIPSIDAVRLFYPLDAAPAASDTVARFGGMVVSFTASEVGVAGNKPAGDLGTLSSPDGTIPADVIIVESAGGGDLETIEELRARVVAVRATRPESGNPAQMREWAMSTPDVALADAFVFAGNRGYGTTDIIPFGPSGSRVVGEFTASLVQAYIDERKASGDDVRVIPMNYNATPVDVEVTVTLAEGIEPDWTGTMTADGDQVLGIPSVLVNGTAAGVVEPGDRMIFIGSIGDRVLSEEVVVTNVFGAIVSFTPALSFAVKDNDIIRPGSDASAGIVEAIGELFEELSPAPLVGTTRYPAESSAYPASIHPANIARAAMSAEKVVNVVVDEPAASVSPAPLSTLRLGSITINYA